MATKRYSTRVQHKSGSTQEWELATTLKPLAGELIVYTDAGGTDEQTGKSIPQIKIGDGSTLVANLPFVGSKETEHAESADSATNAEHATNADNATNAQHANTATSAATAQVAEKTENAISFKQNGTSFVSFNGAEAKSVNFKPGNNVTLTHDANGNLTISATDTVYTHPTGMGAESGLYKITVNNEGHVSNTVPVAKEDITSLGISASSHNHDSVYAKTSHGTHVTYSTTAPVMDGTATAGTATTVARSDHKHPSDTNKLDVSTFTQHTSSHAPSDAEKNQNAFSNITVGSTTVAADTSTDTLTLVAGNNVTITPDAANDKITIAAKDTVYTHPTYTALTGKPTGNQTPGFGDTFTVSQITSNATGHVASMTDRTVKIPVTLSNGTGTAGLIKTSSTVTSASGYTACPVINGVPYYKDTDTNTDTNYYHTPQFAAGLKIGVGHGVSDLFAPVATASNLGVVKSSTTGTTPGRDYSVQVNDDGTMKVNVPWTDTNTVYNHPTHTAKTSGLYKITVDGNGHVSAATAVTKSDITALGIPGTDTNTNYYHSTGSWSGLTYTATANGGAPALAFTLPTGTTSTTVAVGNHTHSDIVEELTNKAPAEHSHTITAGATDGMFDITGTGGALSVSYAVAPYASQQTKRSFDTSTTNPTRTDRLNYNGYLYATKLYSGAKEVSVSGHTHTIANITNLSTNYYNKSTIDAKFTALVIDDGSID